MKDRTYLLNTLLIAVLSVVLLTAVLVRTFAPTIIIPSLNIPNMVLISLIVLLLDHYLAPRTKRCYVCIPLLSALAFGLLPWAACFTGTAEAVKLAVSGGIVFTATVWLFTSIQDRLSSGPACKAAPVISAVGLYLAVQSFTGIFL